MNEPLVSVIMAVYNAGHNLKDTIDSILNQSYQNIEFIIINNGSTDSSAKIIASSSDKRIKFVNNTTNNNWLDAVNKALREARGEFIARMDHDDISLRDRLKEQVNFLKNNPEIGMCGTWMRTFGEGTSKIYKYPITPEECKVHLLFNICMLHPSLLLRKELVEGYDLRYKQEFFPADDMELLALNSDQIKYANLPKVLYKYRVHSAQASITMSKVHAELKFRVQLYMIKKIVPDITETEKILFEKISFERFEYNLDFLKECESFLKKIIEQNKTLKAFDQSVLEEKIQERWFSICTNLSSNKVHTAGLFKKSPLAKTGHFSLSYIKFYLKNIFIPV